MSERASTGPRCIAYREDGRVCRRPASILDAQRGGTVCGEHGPRVVAEFRNMAVADFAELVQESFGGCASILPNAEVYHYCRENSELAGGPAVLGVYHVAELATVYTVGPQGLPCAYLGVRSYDGATTEYTGRAAVDRAIRAGTL